MRRKKKIENLLPDKAKILDFMTDGEVILDVGAGTGELDTLILEKFPNTHIVAMDVSGLSKIFIDILEKKYPGRITFVRADFLDYNTDERFDTIIFCSSLREIVSCSEYGGTMYNVGAVHDAIVSAANILKPQGRIVVRDSIATRYKPKVFLSFKDTELFALANEFRKQFTAFDLEVKDYNDGLVMPYNSAMELLYAITWGKQSLKDEAKIWKGYFTREEWEREGELLFFAHGLSLTHFEKYLHPGYAEHLKGKVEMYSGKYFREGDSAKPLEFPASTSLIVFQSNQVEG